MNQDVTILLLLKGRDEFTIRFFEHAKYCSFPFKILIADGGEEHGIEQELTKRNYSHFLDYEYLRYPYDATLEQFYKKIFDALSKIKTPYVLMASNDDFYLKESIYDAAAFLNKNPDFVSARGKIFEFSMLERSGLPKDQTKYYGNLSSLNEVYPNPSVDDALSYDRLNHQIRKFHSIWHDVNRTQVLKDAYGEVLKQNISDLSINEHYVSFHMAIDGKFYRGNHIHMLHQAHPDAASVSHVPSTVDWIKKPFWDDELERMFEFVSRKFTQSGEKQDPKTIKLELLKRYLDIFVIEKLSEEIEKFRMEKGSFSSLMKALLKHNSVIYSLIKRILPHKRSALELKTLPLHWKVEVEQTLKFLEREKPKS